MNPFVQMNLKKASFTAKENLIYDILINNIDDILRDSATDLADKHNISQASITRFCQKIGYRGYNDFKNDIYKYQKIGNDSSNPNSVIDYYAKIISLVPTAVGVENFETLAKLISKAHFVAINGFHKSALPAQLLELNLAKVSKKSSYIPYDRAHTLVNITDKNDLIIYFSVSGTIYKDNIEQINEMDEDNRPTTVLITMNDKNPMRNKVDQVIWLPNYKNQGYPLYLESQVIFFVFIDLLMNYTANEMKGIE